MPSLTPNYSLTKFETGYLNWGVAANANFDIIDAAIHSIAILSGAVSSVAGRSGAVTLAYTDISGLSTVAHSGAYTDLSSKPTIPTLLSQLTNDAGFLTSDAPQLITSVAGRTGAITLAYTDVSGLATVAHSGAYSDLSGKPTIPVVPTLVSAFTNDSAYITSAGAPVQSVAGRSGAVTLAYTDVTGISTVGHTGAYADLTGKPTLTSGTVTSVALTVPGVVFSVSGSPVTASGTLAFSLLTQNANLVFAGPSSGAAATPTFRALVAADINGLATVAKTGAYSDLSGSPTIPTLVSSLTNDSGFITSTPTNITASGTISAATFTGPATGTATLTANFGSGPDNFVGSYWATGGVAAADTWTIQTSLPTPGLNSPSNLSITHTGSTGNATVATPALQCGVNNMTGSYPNLTVGNLGGGGTIIWNSAGAILIGLGSTSASSALFSSIQRYSSGLVLGWCSGTASATSMDTGMSRLAATSVALGSATAGDVSGSLTLRNLTSSPTTATATSSNNYGSGNLNVNGAYWTGAASASDSWTVSSVIGSGSNPTSTLSIVHTGSTGVATVKLSTLTVTGTAPTVAASQLGIGATTATSATAGSNGAVPSQVAGYLIVNIGGTNFKVPYFAV